MSRPGYVGVSIPQSVIKDVDKLIEKDNHGYKSRAEFFKDAARRLIQNLNNNGEGNTTSSHSDPISPKQTQKKEHNGDEKNYV